MSDLTGAGTRQPNPQDGFEVGQIVRPVAELHEHRPRLKQLRVTRSKNGAGWCSGCVQRRELAGRNRTREDAAVIRPGELYAATKEVSSWLCMSCVEPIPDAREGEA